MSQSETTLRLAHSQPAEQPTLDQTIAATPNRRAVVRDSAEFLGIPPASVYNAMRAIWTTSKGQPDLTDGEIWRGLALVSRYHLDPFSREIYVTRDKKGRLMIIVGIDGWIRILDRTDHYDGFDQELTFDEADQHITRVTTRIYSKNRSHPATYVALAAEYKRLGGFQAENIPDHMLRIFSFKHAARLFVPLGSVFTEEEARWMGTGQAETPPEPVTSLDELADKMGEMPQSLSTDTIAGRTQSMARDLANSSTTTETQIEANTASGPNNAKNGPDVSTPDGFCEWMAEKLANVSNLDEIAAAREMIADRVSAGFIGNDLADQLYELANGAERNTEIPKE